MEVTCTNFYSCRQAGDSIIRSKATNIQSDFSFSGGDGMQGSYKPGRKHIKALFETFCEIGGICKPQLIGGFRNIFILFLY